MNPDTIGCVWTGEFDLNTLRVDGDFFETGKKNLRIQKYPDTCGRGLKIRKVDFTASRPIQPPGKTGKSCIFSRLAHSNENYSRFSISAAKKSFYYLSLSVKIKSQVVFLMC